VSGIASLVARAADGVELSLYRAEPDRAPYPTPVLLVHGTFSNRNFFFGPTADRSLARALAGRGFDCWVAELRGRGRSKPAGRSGGWRFEDWIRLDAPALVEAVLAATGRHHLVWLGHSAGGVIGIAHAAADSGRRVAGLVVAGAPAPTGLGPVQYPMAAAVLGLTHLLGRFPARLLGVGPEDEPAGILEQWMSWNLRGRWLGDDGTDYFAACRNVTVPVLSLAGGGDRFIAPARTCRNLLDAMGGADRAMLVCGRAQGFSEDFDHNRLLVSGNARSEVWPLIGDWLEARFA
jgi:oxygen-independent coproporphyrinogen-3 oxidase